MRVPDAISKTLKLVAECKCVKYLPLTLQLKDYLTYAQQQGYTLQLHVGEFTTFSQPLMIWLAENDEWITVIRH